jgi:hypothetical protein
VALSGQHLCHKSGILKRYLQNFSGFHEEVAEVALSGQHLYRKLGILKRYLQNFRGFHEEVAEVAHVIPIE